MPAAMAPHHQQAIADALPADEVVWLEAEGEAFLALHINEQSGSARGGVIILAEHYHQPSERYWINNLRHSLATKQWHSLVLAMPRMIPAMTSPAPHQADAMPSTETEGTDTTTPPESPPEAMADNEAASPEDTATETTTTSMPPATPTADHSNTQKRQALAHIDAAIRYYNDQGIFNMVILSEASSTIRALQYIDQLADPQKKKQIRGLAMINARNRNGDDSTIELMVAQDLPLLDIYFNTDYRDQREAQERKVAGRKLAAGQYQQIALPRVATNWQKREDRLSKRIRGWLDRTASGFEVDSSGQ